MKTNQLKLRKDKTAEVYIKQMVTSKKKCKHKHRIM